MAVTSDSKFILRTLELAAKRKGQTSPNPTVGAVVVSTGKIVGEGYHIKAGSDHAEIVALKKAGKKSIGATLYVNLEPCCHSGKTGPCTSAIISAGIQRVVFSLHDPDKRVSGKGAATLRRAGIKVASGVLAREAEQLNEYYLFSQRRQRPFVILKLAQSLDGRIATSSGDSKWISSVESRKLVHALRSEVDAIVVGAETVRRDNPKLTVRHVKGRNPYRVVIAGKKAIPAVRHLLSNNSDKKTVVAVANSETLTQIVKQFKKQGVEVWAIPGKNHLVDPKAFLREADRRNIRSLMIEGGSGVATSFLKQKLVDKLVLVTSPMVIGNGLNAIGDLGTSRISNSIRFDRVSRFELGGDQVFVGYRIWRR